MFFVIVVFFAASTVCHWLAGVPGTMVVSGGDLAGCCEDMASKWVPGRRTLWEVVLAVG